MWFHSFEISRIGKLIEIELDWRLPVAGRKEREELLLNGYKVSVWVGVNLEIDSSTVVQQCQSFILKNY